MIRTVPFAIFAAIASSAHAAIPLDACNGPATTTLAPAPHTLEARAIWLDRALAKWPGSPSDGRFRLYHSPNAAIEAIVGRKVRSAAGALDLEISAAVPKDAAERFRYLAAGPVLKLADKDLARLDRKSVV